MADVNYLDWRHRKIDSIKCIGLKGLQPFGKEFLFQDPNKEGIEPTLHVVVRFDDEDVNQITGWRQLFITESRLIGDRHPDFATWKQALKRSPSFGNVIVTPEQQKIIDKAVVDAIGQL